MTQSSLYTTIFWFLIHIVDQLYRFRIKTFVQFSSKRISRGEVIEAYVEHVRTSRATRSSGRRLNIEQNILLHITHLTSLLKHEIINKVRLI